MTNSEGFKIVKEKCSQEFNTSSADEHLQIAKFRHEHPGLASQGIEHVFSNPSSSTATVDKLVSGGDGKKFESRDSGRPRSESRLVSPSRTGRIRTASDGKKDEIHSKNSNGSKHGSTSCSPSDSRTNRSQSTSRSKSRTVSANNSTVRTTSGNEKKSKSLAVSRSRSCSSCSSYNTSRLSTTGKRKRNELDESGRDSGLNRGIKMRLLTKNNSKSGAHLNQSRLSHSRSIKSRSTHSRSIQSQSSRPPSMQSRSSRSRSIQSIHI